jgi:hypothetical protein
MTYVEWLRVRGALKVTLIVLAALFVVAVILRVAVVGIEHNALARIAQLQNDPTSKVTQAVLPDGSTQISIVGKDGSHVTIIDRGAAGKHIQILDPSERSSNDRDESDSNSGVSVKTTHTGQGEMTTIDTDGTSPFLPHVLVGFVIAMIFATILGAAFAKENDGHLEIALTKPIDRIQLALRTIGIDVAGVVASFVLGIVFGILVHMLFEAPRFTYDSSDAPAIIVALLAPIAWYALLNCATASMKRGAGAIIGFAWPISFLIFGLSKLPQNGNALLSIVGSFFRAIAFLNPVSYLSMVSIGNGPHGPLGSVDPAYTIGLLLLLALVYSAGAIYQWRRVEA